MESVFILPVVFVVVLIAIYRKMCKKKLEELDWDKNKDKYKYKGYR